MLTNAAQYHKKVVGELLVEEAENIDDADLGQWANAKNVASLGIRFKKISVILSFTFATTFAVLSAKICIQSTVIKGPVGRKKS